MGHGDFILYRNVERNFEVRFLFLCVDCKDLGCDGSIAELGY